MTLRYLIAGQVQGVGFRNFVHRKAAALGLTGWVRNLPDGRVEVLASGLSDGLRNLEDSLREGPRYAEVEQVEIFEVSDEGTPTKSFEIKT